MKIKLKKLHFLTIICIVYFFILILDSFFLHTFQDEASFLSNVMFFASHRTALPFYTNYPTLYSYLISPFIYVAYLINYFINDYPLEGLRDPFFFEFIFQQHVLLWTWIARALSIFCSLTIVCLIFNVARKRFGERVALFSTALLILDPWGYYIYLSHMALADIFPALLLTYCFFLLDDFCDGGKRGKYYLACFITGLAVSIKFNSLLFIFALIAAPLFCVEKKQLMKIYGFFIFWLLIGVFIGSPYLFINPTHYHRGYFKEVNVLFDSQSTSLDAWKYFSIIIILWKKNMIMTALTAFSSMKALKRLSHLDKLFYIVLIPSVVIFSSFKKVAVYYLLFLYPILTIQIAQFFNFVLNKFKTNYYLKRVTIILIALFFLSLCSVLFLRLNKNFKVDNRRLAKSWVRNNIPDYSLLYLDWGYLPAFHDRIINTPTKGIQTNNIRLRSFILDHYRNKPPYNIIGLRSRMDYKIKNTNEFADIEYLLTSDFCYRRYFSNKGLQYPSLRGLSDQEDNKHFQFYYRLLNGHYGFKEIKRFESGSGPMIQVFRREINKEEEGK